MSVSNRRGMLSSRILALLWSIASIVCSCAALSAQEAARSIPLDGRRITLQAASGQTSTGSVVFFSPERPAGPIRMLIPLFLPQSSVSSNKVGLTPALVATDRLVVDPSGHWYRFARTVRNSKPGAAGEYSLVVEGDDQLLPNNARCSKALNAGSKWSGSQIGGAADVATMDAARLNLLTRKAVVINYNGTDIEHPERELLFLYECTPIRIAIGIPFSL